MSKAKEVNIEINCADDWLCNLRDIWHHPRVSDRQGKESYEVAGLMDEYAKFYHQSQLKDKVQEIERYLNVDLNEGENPIVYHAEARGIKKCLEILNK